MSEFFSNETVLVTGAGSGIGATTAKRFAAEGANVVLVERMREKLERFARVIGKDDQVMIQSTDVSMTDNVEKLLCVLRGQYT